MRPWQRTLRDVDAAVVEAAFAFRLAELGEGEASVPRFCRPMAWCSKGQLVMGLAMMVGFGQAHEQVSRPVGAAKRDRLK
jgi:hypothetical protein